MNKIELIKKYVYEYGLNVLPTVAKSKAPEGATWKEYQNRLINEDEIESKFKNVDFESVRMGIVCGKISGGLEVLDFDNKLSNAAQIYEDFCKLPDVKEIVEKCTVETTQSGGYHVKYRCKETEGNLKLASQANGINEKGKSKYETVIETRGEGGFCVCAPSKGYSLIQGDFSTIPLLTSEERNILISAARTFNQKETTASIGFKNSKKYKEKPWVLYDQAEKSVEDCKQMLKDNRWKLEFIKDGQEYWTRPGKSRGTAATFRGNNFYVFSSSADPFEPEKCYKPSGIYAALKYGTDPFSFKKAVKDFIALGFGEETINSSGTKIAAAEDYLSEKYDFRINLITNKLEMKLKSDVDYHDAEDYDLSSIYRELQHQYISFSYDKLNNLLNSNFVERYDPFIEYFENLPNWDGKDYIQELSATVELTDETKRPYWYKCLRKFLIAMAACATIPDVTNEVSIIFYGSQGEGKTKWNNRLMPPGLDRRKYLFVGTIYDDKDSKMNLSTKLLINLDELGSLNRDEIGYLKSLFSIDSISLREPYMRKAKTYVRRASFVGSIDREEFLSDLAGTRRFLAFSVKKVDYQHQVNMEQVFAQAYSLMKAGEKHYFDKAEIEEIELNNEEFKVKSFEEGLLFEHFCMPQSVASAVALTATEIAQVFAERSPSYRVTDSSIKKIGQILKKYGFINKSVKRGGASIKCWMVEKTQLQAFRTGPFAQSDTKVVSGGNLVVGSSYHPKVVNIN